jgi:FkbM family methyltransferase
MHEQIIIEVGANIGQHTKILHKKYPTIPIYSFEPVPILYERLKEEYKNNTKVNLFPFAIDVENSTKNFYINESGDKRCDIGNPHGCSSLFPFADDVDESYKTVFGENRPSKFRNLEIIKTKTIRLDSFLEELNFAGEIVYFHCDAQGNDINVLRSLGKFLSNVREGQIEVAAQAQLYKDAQNTHKEAVEFLEYNRFTVRIPNGVNGHEADIYFYRQ